MVMLLMKVTLLLSHLGYGGISNMVCSLANSLSNDYKVEIISLYRLYKEPVYDLNDNVNVKYISDIKPNRPQMKHYYKQRNFKMLFKGVFHFSKSSFVKRIKLPMFLKNIDTDVLITTNSFYNNLVSKYVSSKVKKIAWIHTHHNNDKKQIRKLVRSCRNINFLVCVSEELKNFYLAYFKNVFYIPNSLDLIPNRLSNLESKNLISVGKFSKEKGYDDLLNIFKKVSTKHSDWKLNIIGDGLEKDKLLDICDSLKLQGKVIFHGYQNKEYINNILKDSSIYVMTSLSESFGISLIEAMSYGIPCISYTSAQGANEIIENEKNGFLIEDRNEDEMVDKIDTLIEDMSLRTKLGRNARKKAKEYDSKTVLSNWNKIINKRKW